MGSLTPSNVSTCGILNFTGTGLERVRVAGSDLG